MFPVQTIRSTRPRPFSMVPCARWTGGGLDGPGAGVLLRPGQALRAAGLEPTKVNFPPALADTFSLRALGAAGTSPLSPSDLTWSPARMRGSSVHSPARRPPLTLLHTGFISRFGVAPIIGPCHNLIMVAHVLRGSGFRKDFVCAVIFTFLHKLFTSNITSET